MTRRLSRDGMTGAFRTGRATWWPTWGRNSCRTLQKAIPAQLVLLEMTAHKALKEYQEQPVQKAIREQPVPLEMTAHKDLKVYKAQPAQLVQQGLPAQPISMAL